MKFGALLIALAGIAFVTPYRHKGTLIVVVILLLNFRLLYGIWNHNR